MLISYFKTLTHSSVANLLSGSLLWHVLHQNGINQKFWLEILGQYQKNVERPILRKMSQISNYRCFTVLFISKITIQFLPCCPVVYFNMQCTKTAEIKHFGWKFWTSFRKM